MTEIIINLHIDHTIVTAVHEADMKGWNG